ncbi:MAG: hypothetical protein V7L31_27500 [Nostoc sp.]|uniref:hypothetical protein n=1 Tax=Nostoc sp. TaxID=1180 RepID=UPI002FF1A22A
MMIVKKLNRKRSHFVSANESWASINGIRVIVLCFYAIALAGFYRYIESGRSYFV